jgi:thiol-disulfide isomerase/thioredoxin
MLAEARGIHRAGAVNWKEWRMRVRSPERKHHVARRALLLLVMIAGITLVLWAGWHNLRDRRLAMQQANRVQLVREEASPQDEAATSPLKGKPAPQFTLEDLNGKKISLNDFKGHPLLLNFWGTYCAPCKIEMPWLEQLNRKYASDGFQVVGITYDSEVGKATIAKDTKQLGVTYPILLSDPKAEKDYLSDSEVLPMSFYVDRTGKVVAVTAGLGDKDQLESMIKKTIAAD